MQAVEDLDSDIDSEDGSLFGNKPNAGDEEVEQLLADSDSDSAPEDIGFVSSKESALLRVKEALQQIDREKQRKKEKRKQVEEKYSFQKKQKLERLSECRLPAEILDEVSSKARPNVKTTKTKTTIDMEEEEEEEEEETEKDTLLNEEDSVPDEDLDYIPLDRVSDVQAVCIQEEVKKVKTSASQAADFRQQQLYSKNIPRQSVKEIRGIKLKKKTWRR